MPKNIEGPFTQASVQADATRCCRLPAATGDSWSNMRGIPCRRGVNSIRPHAEKLRVNRGKDFSPSWQG